MINENKINEETEDKFRYRLGKWLLNRDECVFTQTIDQNRDISTHEYLFESVNSWVNKKEEFPVQEFVSEMCNFLKKENEEVYFLLMEKCALKGISAGEGIFEALSMCKCEESIDNPQCGKPE